MDFDRLNTSVRLAHATVTLPQFSRDQRKDLDPSRTEYRIGILLQLRKVVGVIPDLCAAVQYCNSQLLILAARVALTVTHELMTDAV